MIIDYLIGERGHVEFGGFRLRQGLCRDGSGFGRGYAGTSGGRVRIKYLADDLEMALGFFTELAALEYEPFGKKIINGWLTEIK